MRKRLEQLGIALAGLLCVAAPAIAGFTSSETFLPAVGRVSGQGGAQFYTTVWATNLTGAPVSFSFDFLKQGQANTSPASFADTLAAGETKVYENVIESKFGIASAIGAARIVANGEILVSERIYNQPPGADVGNTVGLFFAGVPKSFSISPGQSASIQGINQGGSENFRYNFALVETGGGSPTVNVQLFDGSGTLLGQKAYVMQPYEQLQPNVADITAAVHTTNARITATVTGGSGSVLLAGAQLANESQDSSGFEMSFRDDLLGGGGTAGVTSLNGLTGALTIMSGNAISVTPSGTSIQIAYTGGGSSGLTSVTHDATLTGAGTGANRLGIASGGVGTTQLNAAGSTSGQVLTSTGSTVSWQTPAGGGLMLPFSYSGSNGARDYFFALTNSGETSAIFGENTTALNGGGIGVLGRSANGVAVYGDDESNGIIGELADVKNKTGVYGQVEGDNYGVHGSNVFYGTDGYLAGNGYGVKGDGASSGLGVYGLTSAPGKAGVLGVRGDTGGFYGAVEGYNPSTGSHGYLGGHEYGVAGVAPTSGSPVYAGEFVGNVVINGNVHTSGTGAVKFDDPADSANRTITHAFVGSSEMKNIYDGVATLGPSGTATVELPAWFETLNQDFRYQLTALGTPQAGLFISKKVANNQFTIAGGVPGAEVSWQVTGVRSDPWAKAHPIRVRETKSDSDRGFYIAPELYGQPKTKSADPIERNEALKTDGIPAER